MVNILIIESEGDKIMNEVIEFLAQKTRCSVMNLQTHSYVQSFNDLEINMTNREVFHHNKEVYLTYVQFEILWLLAKNPGRVFSKTQIYDYVWNEPYSGNYNSVMSHISHIRKKIEDNPNNPIYIQTVWGIGYRFNPHICRKS